MEDKINIINEQLERAVEFNKLIEERSKEICLAFLRQLISEDHRKLFLLINEVAISAEETREIEIYKQFQSKKEIISFRTLIEGKNILLEVKKDRCNFYYTNLNVEKMSLEYSDKINKINCMEIATVIIQHHDTVVEMLQECTKKLIKKTREYLKQHKEWSENEKIKELLLQARLLSE